MDASGSLSGNAVAAPAPPRESPIVKVVDGVFPSSGGKSCHQCRRIIQTCAAVCTNQKKNKPCKIRVCDRCLWNRYRERAEEIAVLDKWHCPKCQGICDCSICKKRRDRKSNDREGQEPQFEPSNSGTEQNQTKS